MLGVQRLSGKHRGPRSSTINRYPRLQFCLKINPLHAALSLCFFFFHHTATTEIYTSVHPLSLHDALPILMRIVDVIWLIEPTFGRGHFHLSWRSEEHTSELQSRTLISYAVFCLKKKK